MTGEAAPVRFDLPALSQADQLGRPVGMLRHPGAGGGRDGPTFYAFWSFERPGVVARTVR